MSGLLDETRRSFGAAPRTLGTWDRLTPPGWMKSDDPLRGTYEQLEGLLTNGDVIWGHVVQANTVLFRPRGDTAPAEVVYASSPGEEVPPERLRRAAGAAFALRARKLADPGLARIAAALEAESERHAPLDLPDAVAHGVALRMATILVHRALLPSRHLSSCFLPLLANRSRDAVALLPCRYWSGDLVRGWFALGAGQ
jgi:hypothetical protein